MSDGAVLHVKGRVLAGPDDVRDELWVVGGRVSYDRPAGARDTTTVEGWALPGLVDAHCHVGLGAEGPVDTETAEKQALTDRETGTLLIRDAGSPSDTRWIDDRDDLPKIIRAGRHIARTRRYIRNYAWEIEPTPSSPTSPWRPGAATAGSSWSATGSTATSATWPPAGPARPWRAAIAEAHRLGARVTAHCFAENSLRDLVEAGIDCIEHATGLTEDLIRLFAERGVAIVPTLVNIATFPRLADGGEKKFPRWSAHMRRLYERRYDTVRASLRRRHPGLRRHGRRRHTAARAGRGGGRRTGRRRHPAGRRARRHQLGRPRLAGRPGLEEGAPADLVVYASDPRADVRVLAAPRRVVLNGRVVE
ncbi:amidohydrolase [Streptomyces canarius]